MTLQRMGAIETLCKEIGFPFEPALERPDLLVRFAGVLVGHVAGVRGMSALLAQRVGTPAPSNDSGLALEAVQALMASNDMNGITAKAAELHNGLLMVDDEAYPCDHIIDMLSSCVSAVRFGLEKPCRSRHAAEAASHVWSRKYGISLFDKCTLAWENDWARQQLQHIIECGMQFVPIGRQVPIHVDGKIKIGWTTTTAELNAFTKAAEKTAKHAVKELERRRITLAKPGRK